MNNAMLCILDSRECNVSNVNVGILVNKWKERKKERENRRLMHCVAIICNGNTEKEDSQHRGACMIDRCFVSPFPCQEISELE